MSKPTTHAVRQLMLRQRLQQIDAAESAKTTRRELLACTTECRPHLLSPGTITDARRAAPHGTFPSHTMLMLIFEPELPTEAHGTCSIPAGE